MCEHHDGIHLCGQTEELTEWQDVDAMTLRTALNGGDDEG